MSDVGHDRPGTRFFISERAWLFVRPACPEARPVSAACEEPGVRAAPRAAPLLASWNATGNAENTTLKQT
jgi:hypothetical protein